MTVGASSLTATARIRTFHDLRAGWQNPGYITGFTFADTKRFSDPGFPLLEAFELFYLFSFWETLSVEVVVLTMMLYIAASRIGPRLALFLGFLCFILCFS